MLTGKRAFEGQSAASVIAAILEREPAPLNLSPPLDRVVRRSLAKDPDQRFQTALDLKAALTWALEQRPAVKTNRGAWIAVAAATLVLGALGGGWAVSHFHQPTPDERVIRFQISPPEGWGISGGGNLGGGFAISPDGQTVAFIGVANGKTGLWVRPLDAANARLIRGTEGASRPFWSPDSRAIVFSTDRVTLQRVDLSRETMSKICDIPTPGVYWGGSWSSDGRILFVIRDRGIFQVPASGGTPSQLTGLDSPHGETNHLYPQTLPGGRFLYGITSVVPENAGVYAASLQKPTEKVRLLTNATQAEYAPGPGGEGYLLWVRDQTLMAQRFNADKLQLIGESHSLANPAASASSSSHVLLYGSSIGLRQFKWRDRKGDELEILGEPGPWAFSRISPDGRRVATMRAGANPGIWLLETGRGFFSRLNSGAGLSPLWSPDGRTILFSRVGIYRIGADSTGAEERVTQSPKRQTVYDWSRDGRFVIYAEMAPDTGSGLWVLPVTPDGRPSPGDKAWLYTRGPFNQASARFSPDTRWVAYMSDESGQGEIYVRSFPEPLLKIPISTGGGAYPQWGSGGRELFYQSRQGKLMVVTLTPAGRSLTPSFPRELFALPIDINRGPNPYEAAPDGQRFLVSDVAAGPEPLTVIVNWQSTLNKGAVAP
jgi:Tol biopolymer transport system component